MLWLPFSIKKEIANLNLFTLQVFIVVYVMLYKYSNIAKFEIILNFFKKKREGRILSTCLNATKSFFTLELEGFRSLVPFYCFGVTNYLLKVTEKMSITFFTKFFF